MTQITIASLLVAAATFTSAAPTGPSANQNQPRAWYVCASNGFRGECSVDPCAISWCPDYVPYTYSPKVPSPPIVSTTPTPPKDFYRCASNGFTGDCSIDPCYGWSWCPDYEYGSLTPVKVAKREVDPTVCAAGTGFFQSCSNGFRGCCKSDACGNSWCPDFKYGTYEPASPIPKTETVPKAETKPAPVNVDHTVCPAGTGYYQVCGSGFKGCCKTDACTKGYCSA